MGLTVDYTPPSSDEIEISLFGGGSGYGECILVHILGSQWMLFDSFTNPDTKKAIALEYLQKIYTDWDQKIITVNITHWHDDHTKGISQVVNSSRNLQHVCISNALSSDEFMELATFSDRNMTAFNGVRELRKILMLKPRLRLVTEDKVLFKDSIMGLQRQLVGLSPSDTTYINALKFFSQELNGMHESPVVKVVAKPSPNDQSVVNILSIGNQSILFGADLEVSGNGDTGWEAVVKAIHAKQPGTIIYKVPHHGSLNGYYPPIFSELLMGNVYAILTPWNLCGRYLPQKEGIEKIAAHTKNIAITSPVPSPTDISKPKKRQKSIDKIASSFEIKLKENIYNYGHIRMRKGINETEWKTDYFGKAQSLFDW